MNITNDAYIIACKQAGLSDAITAARLGLSVDEVKASWERLVKDAETRASSGYPDLVQQYTIMAHQYQLLGESLKVIAFALDNHVTSEELQKGLPTQLDLVASYLLQHYIILRKFTPADPEESLRKAIAAN